MQKIYQTLQAQIKGLLYKGIPSHLFTNRIERLGNVIHQQFKLYFFGLCKCQQNVYIVQRESHRHVINGICYFYIGVCVYTLLQTPISLYILFTERLNQELYSQLKSPTVAGCSTTALTVQNSLRHLVLNRFSSGFILWPPVFFKVLRLNITFPILH